MTTPSEATPDPNPGRLAVITGVSRGLGRAMAEGFADAGWRVAGCARSTAPDSEPSSADHRTRMFRAVDVTDPSMVDRFAREVIEAFGPPDLLINNAALINEPAPLWEVDPEAFSNIVDVNLKGVHFVIRAFLPAMIAAGRGIVVNFSSGWGRSTSPDVAPYCCTKWGIEGLTAALAQELPQGLAAVALNPGVIDTEMLRSCFGSSAGSHPRPSEWARSAVPFLATLGPTDNGRALTVPGH